MVLSFSVKWAEVMNVHMWMHVRVSLRARTCVQACVHVCPLRYFGPRSFPRPCPFFPSHSFCSTWIPSFYKARISLFSLLIFLPHSSHLPVGLTCWQGNILPSQQKTTLPLGSCSPVEWTHHLWNPQYTTRAVFQNVVMSGIYWMPSDVKPILPISPGRYKGRLDIVLLCCMSNRGWCFWLVKICYSVLNSHSSEGFIEFYWTAGLSAQCRLQHCTVTLLSSWMLVF